MAIDPMALTRRQWLAGASKRVAVLAGMPAVLSPSAWASTSASAAPRLAAAWATDAGYQVGLLARSGPALVVHSALDVPTRAHGLLQERGGTLLAVARRPGDWLLRWRADGHALAWAWAEPLRAFNGHAITSADGRHVFTTETDLETGQGLIGVRNAVTLQKQAEWPTCGMDPHTLLLGVDGSLWVANGGIPTLPETGRLKLDLGRMDASLVHLHAGHGALLGQWRVADPRLSLRHMAWGHTGAAPVLGIALQAEHADAALKYNAPVLALFDGQALQTMEAPRPLAGYGGDIAFTAGCFAISCPRANGVALYGSAGDWLGFTPLVEACALASSTTAAAHVSAANKAPAALWAGGATQALVATGEEYATLQPDQAQRHATPDRLRMDNHWLVLPPDARGHRALKI